MVTGNINNRKSNNAKLIEAYLSDFLYFIHAGHTLFNLEIRDNGDKQREKRGRAIMLSIKRNWALILERKRDIRERDERERKIFNEFKKFAQDSDRGPRLQHE